MRESRKLIIVSIVAFTLLVGVIGITASAQFGQDENAKKYKNLVGSINQSAQSLKAGEDPSDSMDKAGNRYYALFSSEDFENNSYLDNLHDRINGIVNSVARRQENADIDNVRVLRGKVSEMAGEFGVGLPFAYEHSVLVILGFSLSLALIATVACRRLIDWERLREAKEKIGDWSSRVQEAKRSKGKKRRKLELEEDELEKEQRVTWAINIKQAVFYLAPVFLFLTWLWYVYGDWIIAWLPFSLTSGVLQSIGVSLGYFGWFVFSFFGLAQILREVFLRNGD